MIHDNIKYYDIGLNLFCRQFPDPEKILNNAQQAGVKCILTGSEIREDRMIDEFVRDHDVFGTAGIHPHHADEAQDSDFEEIVRILKNNPRVVAVGECGLDFNRMYSSAENQIRCLERQIEIAEQTGKPMFLHEREAAPRMQQIFSEHPALCTRSVVHCFTGDRDTVEKYLEMGFHIGVTGWICDDRRAEDLRNAVSAIPLDRVMLETDAPYLTPRNVKGLDRTNVPQNIVYVAEETAKYMNVAEEELITSALQNTERFFHLNEDA